MEPAETGTPDATPDDARRKVDELEERHVDEPDADHDPQADPEAATAEDAQQEPGSPGGASEPPD